MLSLLLGVWNIHISIFLPIFLYRKFIFYFLVLLLLLAVIIAQSAKVVQYSDCLSAEWCSPTSVQDITLPLLPGPFWPGVVASDRILSSMGQIEQTISKHSVSRVFANGPGDLGSIPGHVIPKTLKMVRDTFLFNTQQYKVLSRVKWSNPGKGVAPSHTSIEKGAFCFICKQMTDVKLWLLYSNTWNHLTVCKKELRLV